MFWSTFLQKYVASWFVDRWSTCFFLFHFFGRISSTNDRSIDWLIESRNSTYPESSVNMIPAFFVSSVNVLEHDQTKIGPLLEKFNCRDTLIKCSSCCLSSLISVEFPFETLRNEKKPLGRKRNKLEDVSFFYKMNQLLFEMKQKKRKRSWFF